MSREGRVNSAIGVSDSDSVNMEAHMGETSHASSAHGEIRSRLRAWHGKSLPSTSGRSASCSPTLGGRRSPPNTAYRRGRSPMPHSRALGPHIAKLTKALSQDIKTATSHTEQTLKATAATAETGQSMAQIALHESAQRKAEIEQLQASMQSAMHNYAATSETVTAQKLNAMAEEMTRRVSAVAEATQAQLLAKQNEELSAVQREIQNLQQKSDVPVGSELHSALSALSERVEKASADSHNAAGEAYTAVTEQLDKVKLDTAATISAVAEQISSHAVEQKSLTEAVKSMIAELKSVKETVDIVRKTQKDTSIEHDVMWRNYQQFQAEEAAEND